MSASACSMQMKVFVYANVRWVLGGKAEPSRGPALLLQEMEIEAEGPGVGVARWREVGDGES